MHLLFSFTSIFATIIVLQLQFQVLDKAPVNLCLAILGVCAILLGIGHVKWRKSRAIPVVAVMLCGLVCGGLYITAYQQILVEPLLALDGQTQQITAVLREDAIVYDTSQRAEIRVENAQEIAENYPMSTFITRCYLPLTEQPLVAGDKVQCVVNFYIPDTRNGFDRETYMHGQGERIWASYDKSSMQNFRIATNLHTLTQIPHAIARNCKQTLTETLSPRMGGFMKCLLFGDKTDLQMEDEYNLTKAGMRHMIAVSGMHISILVGFLYTVCSKKVGTFLVIPLILCFIPMAGASPSVLRAAIMTGVSCLCYIFRRETRSLDTFALAMLVLLVRNPYAIYDMGFQLSFASTLGILIFSRQIQTNLTKMLVRTEKPFKWYKTLVRWFTASIACTLSATIATAPFLLFQMGYITPYALFANAISVFVLTVTFLLGINLCVFSIFTDAVQASLANATEWCASLLCDIAAWVASLPNAVIYLEEKWGIACAILLLLSCIFCVFLKYKGAKLLLPLSIVGIVACAVQYQQVVDNTTVITIHQAGDGQCVTIAAGTDALTVIDCGSSSKNINATTSILEYMHWNNFEQINQLIFTAVDKSHARHAVQLLQNTPVEQVVFPYHKRPLDTEELLVATCNWHAIPYQICDGYGEIHLPIEGLDSTMLSYVDGKFTPILHTDAGDMMLSNSLTQNMLAETLLLHPLQTDIFVLSAAKMEDVNKLFDALDMLQPREIIVQSGYAETGKINRLPTQNTLVTGELTWKTERK